MTQVTNTFATNDMVGIREDLTDVVHKISPTETPFYSMVQHTEASNVLHEWQTVSLAAAANNAAIEGDQAPQTAGRATTRLNNRTQISTKDARVSGTGRAVNTAGRADELDFQVMMVGQELKRDVETALLANKAKVTGNDTLARECAGVVSYLATNTSTTGTDPAGTGADTATNGTQRVFTEDLLKTVLASCFDEGGNPNVLMVNSFNKQKVSGFTGGSTSMQKAEDKTLHAAFSVYESDFGELKIIPNRFQVGRNAYVLETGKWKIPMLRPMQSFDLAKVGDSDAKQVLVEFTLEACNEKASGIVRDLTTS